jgi:nucleotidyltransferase substrate binding protein (TIGR01987 family)
MSQEDIRWEQRFSNYVKALDKLKRAVDYVNFNVDEEDSSEEEENLEYILNDLLKQGLIQSFEYTHELAWNVLKDYFKDQGNPNITGSKDATREAVQLGLISNGQAWMDMIKSRNLTSHTYNEATANKIYLSIIKDYYPEFEAFKVVMEEKRSGQQGNLFMEE